MKQGYIIKVYKLNSDRVFYISDNLSQNIEEAVYFDDKTYAYIYLREFSKKFKHCNYIYEIVEIYRDEN